MGDPLLANFLAEINFISSQKWNGTLGARVFFFAATKPRSRSGKREKKTKVLKQKAATKLNEPVNCFMDRSICYERHLFPVPRKLFIGFKISLILSQGKSKLALFLHAGECVSTKSERSETGGVGGTPLYGLYRYVRGIGYGFWRFSILK